jgi:hypothetical protein
VVRCFELVLDDDHTTRHEVALLRVQAEIAHGVLDFFELDLHPEKVAKAFTVVQEPRRETVRFVDQTSRGAGRVGRVRAGRSGVDMSKLRHRFARWSGESSTCLGVARWGC